VPQLNEIIANRQKKKFVKKNYRAWDLNGTDNTSPEESHQENSAPHELTDQTSLNLVQKQEPLIDSSVVNTRNTENNIETDKNKGSEQESTKIQNSSYIEFNKVQKDSIKSSQEFNKGSTNVQLNSNFGFELGFNNSLYITKKLIRKLGGNERKLFFFVVNICSIKGTLSTGEIMGEDIDITLDMKRNSRETSIKRLQKKGLLIRGIGKRGSNGVLVLSVPEVVKIEALNFLTNNHAEREMFFSMGQPDRIQNSSQNRVQLESKSALYNSSSNHNKTTTDLGETWKKINVEPLRDIGFSETQLKQLYSQNLSTPEIIQESINHFAFALGNNPKVKQYPEPLNVLMGVLRKGQVWFEKNYVSPHEMAQRLINERKRGEIERLKKLEEDAYEMALNEWKNSLQNEEIEKIVPAKALGDITPQRVRLSIYFREKIWPNQKSQYLAEGAD
jgi:hypothetical protein